MSNNLIKPNTKTSSLSNYDQKQLLSTSISSSNQKELSSFFSYVTSFFTYLNKIFSHVVPLNAMLVKTSPLKRKFFEVVRTFWLKNRYTVDKVDERFKAYVNKIKESADLIDVQIDEKFKRKAWAIVNYAKKNHENATLKIKQALQHKIKREVVDADWSAKLYSLALRVQLLLQSSSSDSVFLNKKNPFIKLFGSDTNIEILKRKNLCSETNKKPQNLAIIRGRAISKGSFNQVSEAICLQKVHENSVVRELMPGSLKNPAITNLWEREMSIHQQLTKQKIPGIVKLHGVYSSHEEIGKKGAILEKCDGELSQLITKELSSTQCINIMKQILRCVIQLHHSGFVHGDLKPGNIFYQKKDRELIIKIGDFGFVAEIGSV